MNHDITHCRGIDCPVKDTCYRYIAYQEAVKNDLEYISVLIQNKEEIEKESKCQIYWPIKENKN